MPNAAAMIALMVLFAWIAAIPLTLAVTFLHRRVRVVAYLCGDAVRELFLEGELPAVLVPLTVYGAVIGGMFGPVGIVLYPLVLSLAAGLDSSGHHHLAHSAQPHRAPGPPHAPG